MIPGSGILNMALRVIAQQTFQYYVFAGRTTQPNGQYLATYAAPVSLVGSVQPMPRELVQLYGLDFNKKYWNFYVSNEALDVSRDLAGDQIFFNSITYQVLSTTPWTALDGWNAILAVEVPTP